jgi:hypothetical protein
MTMLLGAAKLLKGLEGELQVCLMLRPKDGVVVRSQLVVYGRRCCHRLPVLAHLPPSSPLHWHPNTHALTIPECQTGSHRLYRAFTHNFLRITAPACRVLCACCSSLPRKVAPAGMPW